MSRLAIVVQTFFCVSSNALTRFNIVVSSTFFAFFNCGACSSSSNTVAFSLSDMGVRAGDEGLEVAGVKSPPAEIEGATLSRSGFWSAPASNFFFPLLRFLTPAVLSVLPSRVACLPFFFPAAEARRDVTISSAPVSPVFRFLVAGCLALVEMVSSSLLASDKTCSADRFLASALLVAAVTASSNSCAVSALISSYGSFVALKSSWTGVWTVSLVM